MNNLSNAKLVIFHSASAAISHSKVSSSIVAANNFVGHMQFVLDVSAPDYNAAASCSVQIQTASGRAAGSDWTTVARFTELNTNTSASTEQLQILRVDSEHLSNFVKALIITTGSYQLNITALVNGQSS